MHPAFLRLSALVAGLLLLASDSDAQRRRGGGCWLAAGSGGMPGRPYFPSGNPLFDRAMLIEGQWITRSFGIAVTVFYYDDSNSPNASATDGITGPYGTDGTIYLGTNLIAAQLGKDLGMGHALMAIMAHEGAHIMQYKNGIRLRGKYQELQADFMAGWYLGARSKLLFTDVGPAFQTFFELGDYSFNSSDHHGTPEERLDAVRAGFQNAGLAATAALRVSTPQFRAQQQGSTGGGPQGGDSVRRNGAVNPVHTFGKDEKPLPPPTTQGEVQGSCGRLFAEMFRMVDTCIPIEGTATEPYRGPLPRLGTSVHVEDWSCNRKELTVSFIARDVQDDGVRDLIGTCSQVPSAFVVSDPSGVVTRLRRGSLEASLTLFANPRRSFADGAWTSGRAGILKIEEVEK